MQAIGELRRQELIDQTVALDPALTFESSRHYPNAIMRAPAVARARVAGMTVGLVDDVEKNGIERRRQSRDNSLLHDHG